MDLAKSFGKSAFLWGSCHPHAAPSATSCLALARLPIRGRRQEKRNVLGLIGSSADRDSAPAPGLRFDTPITDPEKPLKSRVLANRDACFGRAWYNDAEIRIGSTGHPFFRQGNGMKRTSTSAFGVSKHEGHDASAFYNRQLYQEERHAGAPTTPESSS